MHDHLLTRLHERGAHVLGLDGDLLRLLGDHILARDNHVALATVLERQDGADLDLDDLGCSLADLDAQQIAQMHGDGLVHAVAGQAQRRGGDDAAERDDGHFRGAAADIHDHRARRLGDGQVGAHGRSHGLLDEVRLTSAGLNGSLEHRALLHRGCAARDADDDARLGLPGILARRRFADERRDHGLGHVVVGHYAVVQGMLGRERLGRMVDHVLGFVAHCEHAMGRLLDGDN